MQIKEEQLNIEDQCRAWHRMNNEELEDIRYLLMNIYNEIRNNKGKAKVVKGTKR